MTLKALYTQAASDIANGVVRHSCVAIRHADGFSDRERNAAHKRYLGLFTDPMTRSFSDEVDLQAAFEGWRGPSVPGDEQRAHRVIALLLMAEVVGRRRPTAKKGGRK